MGLGVVCILIFWVCACGLCENGWSVVKWDEDIGGEIESGIVEGFCYFWCLCGMRVVGVEADGMK